MRSKYILLDSSDSYSIGAAIRENGKIYCQIDKRKGNDGKLTFKQMDNIEKTLLHR